MVCDRCVVAVRDLARRLGMSVREVGMGYIDARFVLDETDLARLAAGLESLGFELIRDPDEVTVEQIRAAVIEYVRVRGGAAVKLSAWLSERIGMEYKALAALFAAHEGRTVEQYAGMHRVEFAKELLEDGSLTASEVAWLAGYSSVAHLSRRFRDITGMTVTEYRRRLPPRRSLDKV